jgi:carbon-monoxide dehydrogenase medium subunit
MLLPRFTLLQAASLKEACEMLSASGSRARVLAGGTDLLVDLRPKHVQGARGPKRVDVLVSIARVECLRGIGETPYGIRVGALATLAEIERSPIAGELGALRDGAGALGSPLVRNRGTIGGNLANARPAADTAPAVLALGARLASTSARGSRTIRSDEFFTGPGTNTLEPGEILVGVEFPRAEGRSGSASIKLANRRSLDISVVGVAAALELAADGTIARAAVALGAVGPKAFLSPRAAEALVGREGSIDNFAAAARAAATDARPIDDFRGSALYRREMVETLTRRALLIALRRATSPTEKTDSSVHAITTSALP